MENLRYIDINLQNGSITSLFTNVIEEGPYIINYIYNYNNNNNIILANDGFLAPDEEFELPTFVEQELLIPDDAVCGISFDPPNCRTSCDHYFCSAEITRWLEQKKREKSNMTCPTCRTEITRVFVVKNG